MFFMVNVVNTCSLLCKNVLKSYFVHKKSVLAKKYLYLFFDWLRWDFLFEPK
jgi:hypothetical protein